MSSPCPYGIPISDAERIIFICLTAFSGLLSMTGSSLIIYHILSGGRNRLSQVCNRLVLGMSIVDVLSSAAFGLSIIPSPQETICSIGMGNVSTCTAQGFFMQLGMAVPAYNAMLSIYFLLTFRYNMNRDIIAKRYEPFMHAYALIPPLITATIGAINKLFFNESAPCWFGDICKSRGTCGDYWGGEFGDGKWLVISTYIFTGTNASLATLCMSIIYMSFKTIKEAIRRHGFRREVHTVVQNERPSEIEFATNESLKQAFLYFAACCATYSWGAFDIVFHKILHQGTVVLPRWYFIMWGATFPLQGFWNFFAYIRPKVSVMRRRENNENMSFISAVKMLFGDVSNNVGLIGGGRLRRQSGVFEMRNIPTDVVVRGNSSTATATDEHYFQDSQDKFDELHEDDNDVTEARIGETL